MVQRGLSVAGLFAGIGGVERGLHSSGHETELLCEVDRGCQAVLRRHLVSVPLVGDVRELQSLPKVDLVAAGFPCTDLSQAGRTAGIGGRQSGLVGEVFRLLDGMRNPPTWLLLENVPFMLQLDRGKAMHFLVESLEDRGFRWAYRIVDSRAFGLPQRRRRVILLASKSEDPRNVLFVDDVGELPPNPREEAACGFYWTEGLRGLGWAVDAVPTLKGGSTVGIPSPPAILFPSGDIRLPDIRDAERLQGFPINWTLPAVRDAGVREGARWKLVGNAVSVPVFRWVGRRLLNPGAYVGGEDEIVQDGESWPRAAWGENGKTFRSVVSEYPKRFRTQGLADFLKFDGRPLSIRATAGFLDRAQRSSLRFPEGFLATVEAHLSRMNAASSGPGG